MEVVDPQAILEMLLSLSIANWQYTDYSGTHIGPMAEDFHRGFQFDCSDKTISTVDADGVSMAAIQALYTLY